jgi:hypothetical protein
MKRGCIKPFVMLIVFFIVCVALGFLAGSFYESNKHQNENFYSLSKSQKGGIIIGSLLLYILIPIFVLYMYYFLYIKIFK